MGILYEKEAEKRKEGWNGVGIEKETEVFLTDSRSKKGDWLRVAFRGLREGEISAMSLMGERGAGKARGRYREDPNGKKRGWQGSGIRSPGEDTEGGKEGGKGEKVTNGLGLERGKWDWRGAEIREMLEGAKRRRRGWQGLESGTGSGRDLMGEFTATDREVEIGKKGLGRGLTEENGMAGG